MTATAAPEEAHKCKDIVPTEGEQKAKEKFLSKSLVYARYKKRNRNKPPDPNDISNISYKANQLHNYTYTGTPNEILWSTLS